MKTVESELQVSKRGKHLVSLLQDAAIHTGLGITFIAGSDQQEFLSYKSLYKEALQLLFNLQGSGMRPGDELIIQTDDNHQFLVIFWACLLGKIIPVPLSLGSSDDQKQKLIKVWGKLNNPHLIIDDYNWGRLLKFIVAQASGDFTQAVVRKTINMDLALRESSFGHEELIEPNDLAYIQFSSGSTGDPKGVRLTHRNLLANTKDIATRSKITGRDSMLSWMPLTHDMGLICFHLTGVAAGVQQYLLPSALFIRRPLLWIEKASEFGASLLYSPNFGCQYFLTAFEAAHDIDWDLSSVRLIYNGAEPISSDLCNRFLKKLAGYGLGEKTMFPGYGLAEASVAVTLPTVGDDLKVYYLHRRALQMGSPVREVSAGNGDAVSFVGVGYPVDECNVRICNANDEALPSNFIGQIQISGTNVTSGYYNDGIATDRVITSDGWLRTGDLGFVTGDGRLIVTGRIKNIIIVNGQNYYPQDIERVVCDAGLTELGKIVACAVRNPNSLTDEVVVFVYHKGSLDDFASLTGKIKEVILARAGLAVSHIVPVKKIPKTTSGKIQNYKLVQEFEEGKFYAVLQELTRLAVDDAANPIGSQTEHEKIRRILRDLSLPATLPGDENLVNNGLNSLQAIQLVGKLQKACNISLSLADVFDNPTINGLATVVQSKSDNGQPGVTPLQPAEHYELSQTQQKFWFLDQVFADRSASNISVCYRIKGDLNILFLQQAFDRLVERHETLRTFFVSVDGIPRQKILIDGVR
jgi:acyl-CoA synthetase (AMP-forming)/AMP-acid ligase II/aryl carrier-like protein